VPIIRQQEDPIVVNSIQSDKFSSVTTERGVDNSRERAETAASEAEEKGRSSTATTDDRVEVSGAGRLLSESVAGTHASVKTPEQARELASRIRAQLQTLGEHALLTHSGGTGARLSSLLETSIA